MGGHYDWREQKHRSARCRLPHGWPDSVLRFEKVLRDLDAVVRALPGYPFAAPVTGWRRGDSPTAFTIFPEDLVNAPREFAERYVAGVRTATSFA
ncbi:hypothetical protein [Lentzea cavernae]|uniref:Uncharacterized protein n=1 Tax=Lentzea cavernae TaxID=2020703 RepID=A0ABQ3MM59_9PSEU|nr:hypothetical protein [Lentzea cavernae]GHH38959.1 hypothetical protein GCM10017774_29730 [Lentzea cavernae]